MPKEARELASFLAMVIDTTTKSLSSRSNLNEIRCFKKGCHGMVRVGMVPSNEIHWKCCNCENEGLISELQLCFSTYLGVQYLGSIMESHKKTGQATVRVQLRD